MMLHKLEILFLFILIFSYLGTFVIIQVALRKNILDIPNKRSSHTVPTPRGGGVAVVLSWYGGILLLLLLDLIEMRLFLALLSGILLAGISFLDDIYSIKPSFRLIVQILTAASGLFLIGGLSSVYVEDFSIRLSLFLIPVVILAIVWFINLFNFLDGIDGYASIQAIAAAAGMLIITGSPVLMVLIMAVAGFLIWNWPKAKIFMGDTGSTQLGFILIILGFYYSNLHKLSFAGWLILTSLFWIDATLTLYRRYRNHEKLSVAHKKHFYQRIVRYGYSHRKVVLIQIAVNVFFICLVWLSEKGIISYYVTFPVSILTNLVLARLIDTRYPFNTRE